jgi:hypothetical protein
LKESIESNKVGIGKKIRRAKQKTNIKNGRTQFNLSIIPLNVSTLSILLRRHLKGHFDLKNKT